MLNCKNFDGFSNQIKASVDLMFLFLNKNDRIEAFIIPHKQATGENKMLNRYNNLLQYQKYLVGVQKTLQARQIQAGYETNLLKLQVRINSQMTFVTKMMRKYGNDCRLCTKDEMQKLNRSSRVLDSQLRRLAMVDGLKNQRLFKRGKKLGIKESYRYNSRSYAFVNSIFTQPVISSQSNDRSQNQITHEAAAITQVFVSSVFAQPVVSSQNNNQPQNQIVPENRLTTEANVTGSNYQATNPKGP